MKKIFTKNKRAYHDYKIEKTWVAGIALTGAEAKSVRGGGINLTGGYVVITNNQPSLINIRIAPYKPAADKDYDPLRSRKLLLTKKEIQKIIHLSSERGRTLIPLMVFIENKYIKILVGLAVGLKKHDKRSKLKQEQTERSIRRVLRNKN